MWKCASSAGAITLLQVSDHFLLCKVSVSYNRDDRLTASSLTHSLERCGLQITQVTGPRFKWAFFPGGKSKFTSSRVNRLRVSLNLEPGSFPLHSTLPALPAEITPVGKNVSCSICEAGDGKTHDMTKRTLADEANGLTLSPPAGVTVNIQSCHITAGKINDTALEVEEVLEEINSGESSDVNISSCVQVSWLHDHQGVPLWLKLAFPQMWDIWGDLQNAEDCP